MDLEQLEHSAATQRLLALPADDRDPRWVLELFDHIADAAFVDRGLLEGPDGFPYLGLDTPPEEDVFIPVTVRGALERCTEEGLGIVIDPEPEARWVFHYGNLWSLREFGGFLGDPLDPDPVGGSGVEPLEEEREVLVTPPSHRDLPDWARRVMRHALQQRFGVDQPRVCVVEDPTMQPKRALVLDLHPEDFPSSQHFNEMMQRMTWYLPPKRQVVGFPKGTIGPGSFVDL